MATTERPFAGGKMLARVTDAIGTVLFNQPEKHNAISLAMWDGLAEILDAFLAQFEKILSFREKFLDLPAVDNG